MLTTLYCNVSNELLNTAVNKRRQGIETAHKVITLTGILVMNLLTQLLTIGFKESTSPKWYSL